MAIRFQCAACTEPIEVDDHWAMQVVRCPYCQRTVTAPGESTLGELEGIPTATAIRRTDVHPRPFESGDSLEFAAAPQPSLGNGAATASLVLAIVTIVLFGIASIILGGHALEMQDMVEQIEKARREGAGFTQAMMEFMKSRGGAVPGWMIASSLLSTAALGTCLATIVLGALGLRRPTRRSWAVTSLALSGLIVVLYCGGAMFRG